MNHALILFNFVSIMTWDISRAFDMPLHAAAIRCFWRPFTTIISKNWTCSVLAGWILCVNVAHNSSLQSLDEKVIRTGCAQCTVCTSVAATTSSLRSFLSVSVTSFSSLLSLSSCVATSPVLSFVPRRNITYSQHSTELSVVVLLFAGLNCITTQWNVHPLRAWGEACAVRQELFESWGSYQHRAQGVVPHVWQKGFFQRTQIHTF